MFALLTYFFLMRAGSCRQALSYYKPTNLDPLLATLMPHCSKGGKRYPVDKCGQGKLSCFNYMVESYIQPLNNQSDQSPQFIFFINAPAVTRTLFVKVYWVEALGPKSWGQNRLAVKRQKLFNRVLR